jgi:hypothetical protein
MPSLITPIFSGDLAINISALLKDFTEEDFFEMRRKNPGLRVEMSKEGDIIFMPLQKKVYVRRPNAEVEELDNSASISGDP